MEGVTGRGGRGGGGGVGVAGEVVGAEPGGAVEQVGGHAVSFDAVTEKRSLIG